MQCPEVDFEAVEQIGTQMLDQMVNIDLAGYQYNMEKLVDQAANLGISKADFDSPEKSYQTALKYAKCFEKNT